MKKISILLFLFAIFLVEATAVAQNTVLSPSFPKVVPQTPEVSKLIGMINYPVSYNTGLIKTEIPIFDIELSSGYTLPIKLVYQSSGFKPGERSFVGAGWSLVAEPQIAHAVNGLPDEMPYYGLYMNKGVGVSAQDTLLDAAYGYYDIEPDQYFYLLPHKGGSFFLNRPANDSSKKEFVTVPYDPILIGNSADLKSFNITDTDGVKYNFIPMEQTETRTEDKTISSISVYKAQSIVTPNKESISFIYEGLTEQSPYQYILRNYEQSATLDIKDYSLNYDIAYCNGQEHIPSGDASENTVIRKAKLIQRDVISQVPGGADLKVTINKVHRSNEAVKNELTEMCDNRNVSYWQQTITSKYLSRIHFPGGSVEFTYVMITPYDIAQKVLNGIIVKDVSGSVVKRFQLLSEPMGERPCLNAVMQMSKDGLAYRQYNFQYWNRIGMAYDTPETNPWGYSTYSGSNSKQTDIPLLSGKFALYADNGTPVDSMNFCYGGEDYYKDANSSPDLNFMLRSVTYPTGGRSEFQYEVNRFDESRRRKAVTNGSLRIKEIKNYQANGVLASRRIFKYGKNESGVGLPVRVLEDSDFMTTSRQKTYVMQDGYPWKDVYHIYKVDLHARPVVNDYLESSASVVYDCVTEYIDEQGKCGKTVYEYDYSKLPAIRTTRTGDKVLLAPLLNRQSFRKYREWSVGQLKRKSVYDGSGRLLREELNTYREMPGAQVTYMMINPEHVHNFVAPLLTSWEKIRKLKLGGVPNPDHDIPYAPGVAENYFFDGRISFTSGCMQLMSAEVKEYEAGKALSTRTEYEYNNRLLPIRIRRTLNGGKMQTDSLYYPTDYKDDVSQTMVERNCVTPVVRRTTLLGGARYDIYNPYRLSSNVPVMDRIETGKGRGERKTRIRFTNYDYNGNLLEAVKDDSQGVAYVRGYNSRYPVAKIEGQSYAAIQGKGQSLSTSDSTALAGQCEALRASLRGSALVTSYTYRPLEGISSVVSPNGNLKSFRYNNFGEIAAETDCEGNKEKEYTYFYKRHGEFAPLNFSIIRPSNYYLGTLTFDVTIHSGNGGYKYQWFLTDDKDLQYQTQVSDESSFSYTFTRMGTYRLSCQVTDAAKMTKMQIMTIEVTRDLSVSFDYTNHFEDGKERFMEAEFNCPIATDMTFFLEYQTNTYKGITYYITGADRKEHIFTRYGDGTDLVTIKLPQGRTRIYIVYNDSDRSCGVGMVSGTGGITLKYPYVFNTSMF